MAGETGPIGLHPAGPLFILFQMRVLVIGTGSIGCRHLKMLSAIPGMKPLALPIRAERRAGLARAGYAICESISTAAAQGVRQAIIATDTRRHLGDAQAALQAGLDVLVEKPMAPNAREAHAICSSAQQAGRKVFIACNLRFNESLNTFRTMLPRLGNTHAVRIECQSYLPDWHPGRPFREAYSAREEDGGCLRDLIHEIDYAGWLFGWPRAVQARVRNIGRLGITADETADVLWETKEGAMVSVSLDYLSRPTRRRMRASGEHGTMEWDALSNKVTLALADGQVQEILSVQKPDDMYGEQDKAFVHCIQGTPDARLATGTEGVNALAVCDAARRASTSRGEEGVEYL